MHTLSFFTILACLNQKTTLVKEKKTVNGFEEYLG